MTGLSPLTGEAYRRDLRDFGSFLELTGVAPLAATRRDVELYRQHLERARGLAASTVARRLVALSGYYRLAVEDEYLARSPMLYVRRPKVPTDSQKLGLSRDELQRLLDAAMAHSARGALLVALLSLLGLRVSEACHLTVSDVGVDGGVPVLRVIRKANRLQTLPLCHTLMASIETYVAGRRTGPLLLSKTGRPLDRTAAARLLRKIATTGLPERPDVHPHLLRHAWVTNCLNADVPIRDLTDAAGVSSPTVVMRYDRSRYALDRHPSFRLEQWLGLSDVAAASAAAMPMSSRASCVRATGRRAQSLSAPSA